MNATTHVVNGKSENVPALAAVRDIDLGLLVESSTQPRKTFVGVEDLGKDIAQHGVLQPILVRPKGKKFEIVFGARRYRGAKLAKLSTIPAMVRDIDDAKALELQIVENSQREDVHPLEEADGYQALHEKHGYTIDEIAAKVGKSTATIYARLKYIALIPEARNAFFDQRLNAATALIIARIPHADLQKKALAEITKKDWSGEMPATREAARIVRDRFMLRLVDAPFDRADLTLVKAAGACAACPKRTGNQKELFADLESKDDLCIDPKCFEQKRDAANAKKIADATTQGIEVLTDKAAKKLFMHGSLNYGSGYVDLDDKDYTNSGKTKTKRELLGKTEAKIVLARDSNGKLHELVSASTYAKATKKPAPKPTKSELRYQKEAEAKKKATARASKKSEGEISLVVKAAERRQPNDAFWRVVATVIAKEYDFVIDQVLEGRGQLDSEKKNEDLFAAAEKYLLTLTGAQTRGFVVEMLMRAAHDEDRKTLLTFFKPKKKTTKK